MRVGLVIVGFRPANGITATGMADTVSIRERFQTPNGPSISRSEDHREDRSAGFGGFLRVSVGRNPPIESVSFQGVMEVGGLCGFLWGT